MNSFRLLNIQRKLCEGQKAISYFITNKWISKNDNFVDLCSVLRPEDLREFEYRHDFHFDIILAQRYTILCRLPTVFNEGKRWNFGGISQKIWPVRGSQQSFALLVLHFCILHDFFEIRPWWIFEKTNESFLRIFNEITSA